MNNQTFMREKVLEMNGVILYTIHLSPKADAVWSPNKKKKPNLHAPHAMKDKGWCIALLLEMIKH